MLPRELDVSHRAGIGPYSGWNGARKVVNVMRRELTLPTKLCAKMPLVFVLWIIRCGHYAIQRRIAASYATLGQRIERIWAARG